MEGARREGVTAAHSIQRVPCIARRVPSQHQVLRGFSYTLVSQPTLINTRMAADRMPWTARLRRAAPQADVPALLLLPLEHVRTLEATDWLRTSMPTFARSVASFLPGHFDSYMRVYHPFENNDGTASGAPTWHAVAAGAGADLNDPVAYESLPASVEALAHVDVGSLSTTVIDPLIEHLGRVTRTPERCFCALWEGFGDSVVPGSLEPKLELPHRRYHVFAGPIEGMRTSFSVSFRHRSANLWWPADHAWCVATEVDLAWTYVGGPRSCIHALLADPRLEAVETSAAARW